MTAKGWGVPAGFASGARLLAAPYYLQGGEVAGEGAALAQLADDIQPRAVAQQHMLDDGQAQASTAGIAGAAGIDPVEALGQARQMLGLDAQAAVLHAKVRALFIAPPANANLAFIRGVFHGVEHQVGKGAAQLCLAALELEVRVRLQADTVMTLAGQCLG